MYLRELRLHGFKSFADPTRLELQRGVTAIVGPNGCGKSNIADALRWVLGEQSAKSLRAGAMQDVIFQGTSQRKPVNLCQVSLVFTECEDRLGSAYHEVEVTRRVVRDGGSEYFLNGKSVRLKDIQRLFLDTGIGQVSYSFMLQGQIDQVLSSNPAERRAIFEEAAGISRYKAQRREALAKLAQVDANLARVTDVMEEVARQVGSLKRQAAKALRYQRIQHRLRHLELGHGAWQCGGMQRQCRGLRDKLAFLAGEVSRVQADLAAAEGSLGERRAEVAQIRARMEALQQCVYRLRAEKDGADNRAEMAGTRLADLAQRQQRLEAELEQLAAEEQAIAAKLAGEIQAKQEQLDLFGSSDEEFQRRSEALAQLQAQVGAEETQLSRDKQSLLLKESQISRLRSNCTSLELDLKTYQVRHANLTEELQRLREEQALHEQERDQLEQVRIQRQQEREEKLARLQELKQQAAQLTQSFRQTQAAIQQQERDRAGLRAQLAVLEDLQAKFEGFSEGARALLQGKLDTVVERSELRLFLQKVRVEESFTAAAELLLGVASEGILLKEGAPLGTIAEQLRERKLGRASLLLARPAEPVPDAAAAPVPQGWQPASSIVRSDDPEVSRFLGHYLSDCYFVESLDALLAGLRAHPDARFHTAVTASGEWVDGRGLLLVGAAAGQKKNSSYLARQGQIKKLGAESARIDEALERLRLEAGQIQGKIDLLEKRTEEQQARLAEMGNELATIAAQREAAQRSLSNAQNNLRNKSGDLARQDEQQQQSTRRLESARAELAATEAEIDGFKQRITTREADLEALRQQREAMREQFNEARFEIARKRQRLELLDRGLEELQRKSRDNEAGRIERRRELDTIGAQTAELRAQQAEQVAAAQRLSAELADCISKLDTDREQLRQASQRLDVLERGLAPKREALQKLSHEHGQTEVQLAKDEARLQFLIEECQNRYEADVRELVWQQLIWQAGDPVPERIRVDIEDEAPEDLETSPERPQPTPEDLAAIEQATDWPALQQEIQSLKIRLQALGPVNLVAIGEYKDLKQRHEFLSTQSKDLWQAKDQLLQAIDEINQTSQRMFAETFGAIRSNFHYTFETLFGGGKADLSLVDSGDVLESGIDITAQPPGTRLKSLGLLSGGQKTMTAVALLFAIYMVKPSPFCVLDEIDAPLDDANIGRFTSMLERFLQYSQFLIITHNKRTIRVADTIYGATMQEKGVSRVISMRFNKATGDAEAADAAVAKV